MADGEHANCQAIEDFLNEIPSVSRPIIKTERINSLPVHEGYTASYYDKDTGNGFTVIAWGEGGSFMAIREGLRDGKLFRSTYEGEIAKAKQFGRRVNAEIFG